MKKLILFFGERRVYEKAYQQALDCAIKGDKLKSFAMFNELLQGHPHDVNVRRQILLLANELGKDVNLPDENIHSLKH